MPPGNAARPVPSTRDGRDPGRPRRVRLRSRRERESRGPALTSFPSRHRVSARASRGGSMRPDQNPGQQCGRRGPGALFSPALLALVLVIVCTPTGAEAQRPDNIPRIGYLILSPLADPPSAERQAFLDGLRDLGYVVGRNIIIEYRSAAWNRELLPDLAAELIDRKVALIVAVPGAIEAARDATKTIPIVITSGSDPLERGLVASLARPGGNITGTANSSIELTGKRLELLREALPKISRVAVLWNPTSETAPLQWSAAQAAARKLGVTLQSLEVKDPK